MNEPVQFSIVIPVLNEEENIPTLIQELNQAAEQQPRNGFETIFVDDHSTDQSFEILRDHATRFPWLRVVRLRRQSGQSAALWYGVRKARYPLIVTLDGDGQNDPADIPHLLDVYSRVDRQTNCCLVNGCRVSRKDSSWRRLSSFLANGIRRRLLGDDTPDSGCGIKVYSRETFLELAPFNHMHRFLPALVRQRGGRVVSVAVNHRARTTGTSHYGTVDRLVAGIVDLAGVLWLKKRVIPFGLIEEEEQHG